MKAYELFKILYKKNLIDIKKNSLWWENTGTFQTLIEVFLTQQTKWEKVQQSIKNLQNFSLLQPQKILEVEQYKLASAIVPSGFYNQKATRIKLFVKNMLNDFDTFENFKNNVNRNWLLEQKGIGFESADSILCYVCFEPVMVVDNYTNKLFKKFNFEFENYNELKEYLENNIFENETQILNEFKELKNIHQVFAIFHGMIVELCKQKIPLN
jgi:endonuclease-3 related protein